MTSPREARKTWAYQKLVDRQRALGLPCWLCGHPIDYRIKGRANSKARWGFTLDHYVPLSKGGSLLDPANARSAHRSCNSAKGSREAQRVPNVSRAW